MTMTVCAGIGVVVVLAACLLYLNVRDLRRAERLARGQERRWGSARQCRDLRAEADRRAADPVDLTEDETRTAYVLIALLAPADAERPEDSAPQDGDPS